jgi:hypothetical protein
VIAANAVLEAIRITGWFAAVDWLPPAEFLDAGRPESGMLFFGSRHVFQRLLAAGVSFSLGQGAIGKVARHFGLPVLFQNLGQPGVTRRRWDGLRGVIQNLLFSGKA